MNNLQVGKLGENLAKEFLVKNGYDIIAQNVKFSRFCELDIIAKIKNTLVFVEVKTRTNGVFSSPIEAITKNKYQNIKNGAYFYLQDTKIKYDNYRIDAISVVLKPSVNIQHFKNISYG